jgi:hypothetical protein
VFESALADGVDLEQEGAAGIGPPSSPVHQAIGRGGQNIGGARPGGAADVGEEALAELVVAGQEGLLLVSELLVEGGPGDPRGLGDVGHGRGRVAAFADHVEDRVQDPLPLRGLDLLPAEAVRALGKPLLDLNSHVHRWYGT